MYSAESVIRSLKANAALMFEGIDEIKCPNLGVSSCENTTNCTKGATQECKQLIKIFSEYRQLSIIKIRFMVAPKVHEGFIPKNDSSLTSLIKHSYIDRALLASLPQTRPV
jgi:hypothetical protein